jgi:hypothetical protein
MKYKIMIMNGFNFDVSRTWYLKGKKHRENGPANEIVYEKIKLIEDNYKHGKYVPKSTYVWE